MYESWAFAATLIHFSFYGRKSIMRIILDTDKKTITVPWNYAAKLEEYNNMVMAIANDPAKKKTFKTFIDDVWRECMSDTDKHLKVADKPKKPNKKDEG